MQVKKVYAFPMRPTSIKAPTGKGLEMAVMMERHAHEALRRNEKMLRESREYILELMGDATEMILSNGDRYVRENIQREGFTIEPTSYASLTYYEANRE